MPWAELASRLASQSEPARLGSAILRAGKTGSARLVPGSRAAPSRAEPLRARAELRAASFFFQP